MTSFSAKIVEVFRNLRSDAVPRDPRPTSPTINDVAGENHNNENGTNTNTQEDIEPENIKVKKPKKKFQFNKRKDASAKPKNTGSKTKNDKDDGSKVFNVNTQATGNVITVLESPNFRLGNDFVYNLGPTHHNGHNKTKDDDPEEELIEKNNDIILLMEAKILPEHDYIDYIAKNLGKNWHQLFRKLGYTKGRIETVEIDEARNGVSEARYKLLLEWMRNDKDGTLGRLATILWTEGERQIVKELSLIYVTNNGYKQQIIT